LLFYLLLQIVYFGDLFAVVLKIELGKSIKKKET